MDKILLETLKEKLLCQIKEELRRIYSQNAGRMEEWLISDITYYITESKYENVCAFIEDYYNSSLIYFGFNPELVELIKTYNKE